MIKIYLTILFAFLLGAKGFTQTRTVTFSTAGTVTWTAPCGVTSIQVEAIGGGGPGGAATGKPRGGGGGAGGAYVSSVNVPVTPGTTYTINVGNGGLGTNSSSSNAGGDSWFGTPATILAKGGAGGLLNNGSGGTGTIAGSFGVGTTTVYPGGNGYFGTSIVTPASARSGAGGGGAGSGGAGGNATATTGGAGTMTGGGAGANSISTTGAGLNGGLYGGGGSGAVNLNSTPQTGGNGGGGLVRITYSGVPTYCIPSFITEVEPITNVTFTGNTQSINNTSPSTINSTPALESFCNMADVIAGLSYTISVQGNTNDNTISYTDFFIVYIDWNQNGVFGDLINEKYNIGTINGSTGTDGKTATTSILVPSTALSGITSMRVIKNLGAYSTPCAANNYGQAEDYLISVTGNCTQPTGAKANNATTTLTVCEGTIVAFKETGGILGTGAQWTWYTGGCGSSGGGTLVNTNINTNGDYTYLATVGTRDYFVRGEGGSCGTSGLCRTVRVIVKPAGTIALSSGTKDFPACKGVNNSSYVAYTIGGATTATVSGLPTGLSGVLTGNQLNIQGTPSVSGTYNYTVTLSGNAPCVNPTISGTITVSQTPLSLTYSTPVATYCTGSNITPNNPIITGGTPDAYSISPALPGGLSLDPVTGIITGQPVSASPSVDYLVIASNGCGSKSFTLKIAVSNGDMVFNVTPGGTQNICSTSGGIVIGLGGSEIGINYQLYINGSPSGSLLPGTGSVLNFGAQTAPGTYTITTTSGCATNMNGNTILYVTQVPTTTFSYTTPNCQAGSLTPSFGGSPQSGLFSATPAGIAFTDNSSGLIDLSASLSNTYSITYTIPATGGCPSYVYTQNNFVVGVTPVPYNLFGGGGYCSGDPGVEVGVDNSKVGVNYQLYNGGVPVGSPIPGTNSLITFGLQTAGNYTVVGTSVSSPNCQTTMNGNAVVTLNTNPNPVVITPASSTLCQGTIVSLEASGNPPATSNVPKTVSSGNINLSIPDNSFTGIASLLKVSGIPAGATITNIAVRFTITHSMDGDLLVNLKGPNSNVLNLVNGIGGSGQNFTATVFSTSASSGITTASAPFTGTWLPQASIGVIGANVVSSNISNTSTLSGLYGGTAISANGNWILSVRDNADQNVGTIKNWSISISYSYTSNPVNVTWLPATGLYIDPGAITPYVAGTSLATVYSKPANAGTQTYTATASNIAGCSTAAQAVLNINPSPTITVSADYCNYPGAVRITATSDIPVTSWIWSNGLTGTNTTTSSYVTVNTAGNYYVSAISSANSCPGTGVMSIAQELVVNGDFEAGNTGFVSGYPYVSNTTPNGLLSLGTYSVHNDPHFLHNNFWGTDHTTANGEGNYMLINGTGGTSIWKETVTVLPNTTYYFSAYAVSLNNVSPFADLRFMVNGVQVGSNTGALPSKSLDNNPGTWIRFYGNWPSGVATTADIEIIDLQNAASGNDFGLDDISFATLSSFLDLTSGAGTDLQNNACINTPITDITYDIGGDGNTPLVNNIPPGLSTLWNGRTLRIYGIPVTTGNYTYTVQSTGCNVKTVTGKINVIASVAGIVPSVTSACYNSGGSITVSGSAGSLMWQSSTDGGFTWNNTGNTSITQNFTNLIASKLYRVIANNKTCTADTSGNALVGIHNLWTGAVDTDWNNFANWSDNTLPSTTPCPTVTIPQVPVGNFYPLLNTGVAAITNLVINPNASLTVAGARLQIAGSITNNGIFDVSQGTIVFNGSGSQILAAGAFTNNSVHDVVISNSTGVILNGAVDVYGSVTYGSANGKLTTNNNLTLKSLSTGTASVGTMTGTNTLTGNVTVERYIGIGNYHPKSWQLLAIPTDSLSLKQTINQAWQDTATAPNQNRYSGFGTQITGAGGIGAGFDVYTATPSMKIWVPGSSAYVGVSSTYLPVYNQKGYFLFVRGDRSITTFNTIATTPTILRTKGQLFTPGHPAPVTNVGAGQFESVGNPYASAIDIRNISKTPGVDEFFYVWDPYLGSAGPTSPYGLGGFITLSLASDGNYYATPQTPTYNGGIHDTLQSGQAFFVYASGGGTVSFDENCKVSGDRLVNSPVRPPQLQQMLRTNLYGVNPDGSRFMTDGALNQFGNNYSNSIDGKDARKNTNTSENLSIKSSGSLLAIERRQMVSQQDTIFLNLTGVRAQPYRYEFIAQNMNVEGLEGFVEDNYLHTRTPLDLSGTTLIDFTIANIAGSYAADRFRIVFAQNKVLPVTITDVKAYRHDKNINVEWKVENERNIKNYTVEKSADGIHFGILTVTPATGNNSSTASYQAVDDHPVTGYNYYRIRSTDQDGKAKVTKVVKVLMGTLKQDINIYPNPITDGMIHLQFMNEPEGKYGIRLLNKIGQVIVAKGITRMDGNSTELIKWDFNLAHGMYQLEVTKPDGSIKNINVLY